MTQDRATQTDPSENHAVRSFFDGHSVDYTKFFDSQVRTGAAVVFQRRAELLIEMLQPERSAGLRLLDLAAGSGEVTRAAVEACGSRDLVLNDFSAGMLEICKRNFADLEQAGGQIAWSNRDVFELGESLQPESFDVVLCMGLIAHTGRLDDILSLAHRVLKPGGVMMLQSSLADHPGDYLVKSYARSRFYRKLYMVSMFRKAEILSAAARGGFRTEQVRRFAFGFPFGDRICSRLNHAVEKRFAARMETRGSEALFKFRKDG